MAVTKTLTGQTKNISREEKKKGGKRLENDKPKPEDVHFHALAEVVSLGRGMELVTALEPIAKSTELDPNKVRLRKSVDAPGTIRRRNLRDKLKSKKEDTGLKRIRKSKKKRKKSKKQIHNIVTGAVGPKWFQELSNKQMRAMELLKTAMLIDFKTNSTEKTQELLAILGLVLRPSRKMVQRILKWCHDCPVEFLLSLYQLMNPKRKKYSLNDRLVLSSVVHLAIENTLKELHIRIPSPPRLPPKTPRSATDDQTKKKVVYESPYLEPYDFKPAHRKPSSFKDNRKFWAQSPYFAYVSELVPEYETEEEDSKSFASYADSSYGKTKKKKRGKSRHGKTSQSGSTVSTALKKEEDLEDTTPSATTTSATATTTTTTTTPTSATASDHEEEDTAIEAKSEEASIDMIVKADTELSEATKAVGTRKSKSKTPVKEKRYRLKTRMPSLYETKCQQLGTPVKAAAPTQTEGTLNTESESNASKYLTTAVELIDSNATSLAPSQHFTEEETSLVQADEASTKHSEDPSIKQAEETAAPEEVVPPKGVPAFPSSTCPDMPQAVDEQSIEKRRTPEKKSEEVLPCNCEKLFKEFLQAELDKRKKRDEERDAQPRETKFVVSGIKETPDGPLYIFGGVMPPQPCDCSKLSRQYEYEHKECLDLFDKYVRKMEEDLLEYAKDVSKEYSVPMSGMYQRMTGEHQRSIKTSHTSLDDIINQNYSPDVDPIEFLKGGEGGEGDPLEEGLEEAVDDLCRCRQKLVEEEEELMSEPLEVLDMIEEPCQEMTVVEETTPDDVDPMMKRIHILDRLPKTRGKFLKLVETVLKEMAEDGWPLAKLPNIHKLPHFRLWIRFRMRHALTQNDRDNLLKQSADWFDHCSTCHKEEKYDAFDKFHNYARKQSYYQIKEVLRRGKKVMEKFVSTVRQNFVDQARETFPPCMLYDFPSQYFRDVYFAYFASKEEDVFVYKPWEKFDFRDHRRDQVPEKRAVRENFVGAAAASPVGGLGDIGGSVGVGGGASNAAAAAAAGGGGGGDSSAVGGTGSSSGVRKVAAGGDQKTKPEQDTIEDQKAGRRKQMGGGNGDEKNEKKVEARKGRGKGKKAEAKEKSDQAKTKTGKDINPLTALQEGDYIDPDTFIKNNGLCPIIALQYC